MKQDGAIKWWIEVIDSFQVNSPVNNDVTDDSRPNDVETNSATQVRGIDWAPHCLLYGCQINQSINQSINHVYCKPHTDIEKANKGRKKETCIVYTTPKRRLLYINDVHSFANN